MAHDDAKVYALNLFDVADREEYLAYSRRSAREVARHGGRVVALGRFREASPVTSPRGRCSSWWTICGRCCDLRCQGHSAHAAVPAVVMELVAVDTAVPVDVTAVAAVVRTQWGDGF